MATLYNPTEVDLDFHHNSILYIVPAGEKLTNVPDRAANHGITHRGTRGLMELKFEDSEDPELFERNKAAAIKRWRDYERKQVQEFNRVNLLREKQGLLVYDPEPALADMAKRSGLKINVPYEIADADREAVYEAEKQGIQA